MRKVKIVCNVYYFGKESWIYREFVVVGEARYRFSRIVFIICMVSAFPVHRISININSDRKKGFEFSSVPVRNYKNPSRHDHRGISSLDGST